MTPLEADNRSQRSTRRPCAYVAGAIQRLEFQRFRDELELHLDFICCMDVEEAVHRAEDSGRFPHIIFFIQSYPGQWPESRIAPFQRAFPTARAVQLLGSWCEGEKRTGDPIPGVFRFYWHQWTPALCRELEDMLEGRPSIWLSPPTAAAEELAELATRRPLRKGRGLVLIESKHPEMKAMLRDACQEIGYAPIPRAAYSDPILSRIVIEVDDVTDELLKELQEKIASASPHVRFVIVAGFARAQDVAELLEAGASFVLSKPFDVAELADALQDCAFREESSS
jgi:CheY-like chemotaxis protein